MKTFISISLIFFLCLFIQAHSIAQGVLFSEYRLIFTSSEMKTIQVCNPTEQVRSFSISLVDKELDEDGELIEIPDTITPIYSFKKNIRFFPRNIKLAPGKCQEVQIQVKGMASRTDGEYRSYLYMLPLEVEDDELELDGDSTINVEGVRAAISFRVSAAIPLLYRNETKLEHVAFTNVRFIEQSDSTAELRFTIEKKGNQSTFGTILVEDISNDPVVLVERMPGAVVYGEMERRNFILPIRTKDLSCDAQGFLELKLSYVDGENRQSKQKKIIAELDLRVGVEQNSN